MPKVEELEEKIKLSRQLIKEILDGTPRVKVPLNKRVELIQISGFLDLAQRNKHMREDEQDRIEKMIERMGKILNSLKGITKPEKTSNYLNK